MIEMYTIFNKIYINSYSKILLKLFILSNKGYLLMCGGNVPRHHTSNLFYSMLYSVYWIILVLP